MKDRVLNFLENQRLQFFIKEREREREGEREREREREAQLL